MIGIGRKAGVVVFAAFCTMTLGAPPAHAQSASPTIDVSLAPDGAVIAGSLLGMWAISHLPVARSRWRVEPFSFDGEIRGIFSVPHAMFGDAFALAAIAAPVVAEVVRGDSEMLSKGVVYLEVLSLGGLFNAIAKYTVQRPRPYRYSTDLLVTQYADKEENDAYLSFFSGHSTTAFAAGVSGSYLFAYGNPNIGSRAFVWGFEMAMASATATERVRAGKHFPSDVILGAAVGAGIGILVPRAHMSDRAAVAMEPEEWASIGGGLVLGTTLAALLPSLPTRSIGLGTTFRVVPSISPTNVGFSGVF